MATTTDSSGTITQVAKKAREIFPNAWVNIGYSVAAHCFADLAAMGAKPKIFLDYLGSAEMNPRINSEIIYGMSTASREADCVLIGGETAQMPDIFKRGERDIVGFTVGFMDRHQTVIAPQLIKPRDIIIGINSYGLHLNGFSLVRKILFKPLWKRLLGEHKLTEKIPNGTILAAELLTPMPNYGPLILALLKKIRKNHSKNKNNLAVHGLAHVTGGGIKDNIERLLPENCQAKIYKANIKPPPIFPYLQKAGGLTEKVMFKTFNMGVGFVIIAPKEYEYIIRSFIKNRGGGLRAFSIGEITEGEGGVDFID